MIKNLSVLIILGLALLLVLFPLLSLGEEAEQQLLQFGEYQYRFLENDTVEIVKYNGAGGAITIPSEIEGYSVTSIGENAFQKCNTIISVEIPEGVCSIERDAFYLCKNLVNVHFPDSVTYIGRFAFGYCNSLEKAELPENLSILDDCGFYGCDSITYISFPKTFISIGSCALNCRNIVTFDVPEKHPNLAVIDGVLFSKPDKTILRYPGGKEDISYSIPQGIVTIADRCFEGCISLESVSIPESVTTIGESAFMECNSLRSINIPDNITTIGQGAFYSCNSLKSIIIPNHVTRINTWTFYACKNLEEITIPSSVNDFGSWVFDNCENLRKVILKGDSQLRFNPFESCPNIQTIEIDENSKTHKIIDGVLFSNDGKILIMYPSGLDILDYSVPSGTEIIRQYAFNACNFLRSVTIPDTVTKIGNAAIKKCENLLSVNIPDTVTSLDNPFISCKKLVVTVSPNSYAAQYCLSNNYPIRYNEDYDADEDDWLNN